MQRFLFFFFIVFCQTTLLAQETEKEIKKDTSFTKTFSPKFLWGGIIGPTSYLGDLGVSNKIIYQSIRYAMGMTGTYQFSQHFSFRLNLLYARVSGSDEFATNPNKKYRNLSFRSPVIELSAQFIAQFPKEQIGHRYKLKGVRGKRMIQLNFYLFAGVGVFYFNPEAQYLGKWYALQPIYTEGIKYSPISICLPLGMGIKKSLSRYINIGMEIGIRLTDTDYLDDVSGTYIDPKSFDDPIAASLSVRSSEVPELNPSPGVDITAPGMARGDPNSKDKYIIGGLIINYSF
ncbi:hypothetical protein JYT36_00925 [Bacteroidales bacterium AH-315-N07]|nr:hypothetical protein [Bacteroidales bacterium AH-315-N07]